ncbi:MAG TPA: DUF1572 family protein [Tepidisphaeraceae bacterium]|nr:DUF1572 family protein [Tepidisphaeraceae bacterium]
MPSDPALTRAYVDYARKTFTTCYKKVVHCLKQLSDEDVNWRPFVGANSVANIVVHLCGNVGQWVVQGVGQTPIERDRPGEFAQDLRATPGELVERLTAAYEAADAAMAGVTADTILAPRKIQSYDETVLGAIFHAVSHFEGHTHQVVLMTRLRLGERYVFKWVPAGGEISAKKA